MLVKDSRSVTRTTRLSQRTLRHERDLSLSNIPSGLFRSQVAGKDHHNRASVQEVRSKILAAGQPSRVLRSGARQRSFL